MNNCTIRMVVALLAGSALAPSIDNNAGFLALIAFVALAQTPPQAESEWKSE